MFTDQHKIQFINWRTVDWGINDLILKLEHCVKSVEVYNVSTVSVLSKFIGPVFLSLFLSSLFLNSLYIIFYSRGSIFVGHFVVRIGAILCPEYSTCWWLLCTLICFLGSCLIALTALFCHTAELQAAILTWKKKKKTLEEMALAGKLIQYFDHNNVSWVDLKVFTFKYCSVTLLTHVFYHINYYLQYS